MKIANHKVVLEFTSQLSLLKEANRQKSTKVDNMGKMSFSVNNRTKDDEKR
jgi:hypothetical protein